MPITTPYESFAIYGDDAEHFLHVAEYLLKPAANEAGFEFIPPSITSGDVIQAEVIMRLNSVDLVLCDISTLNANVFFELGIRTALNRPVAMIRDSATADIPFDTAFVSCHTYDARLDPWVLSQEIPKLAEFIAGAASGSDNSMWRRFGIAQAAATSPSDPVDAKLTLVLDSIEALRRQSNATSARNTESVAFVADGAASAYERGVLSALAAVISTLAQPLTLNASVTLRGHEVDAVIRATDGLHRARVIVEIKGMGRALRARDVDRAVGRLLALGAPLLLISPYALTADGQAVLENLSRDSKIPIAHAEWAGNAQNSTLREAVNSLLPPVLDSPI